MWNGSKKEKTTPKQADFPSTAFGKYSKSFHIQKGVQSYFFLSSLVHHENRTGVVAWPKSPSQALEISSFLAMLF